MRAILACEACLSRSGGVLALAAPLVGSLDTAGGSFVTEEEDLQVHTHTQVRQA